MIVLVTSWVRIDLAAALVLGLVLVVRGLRGRRVGDTPFCRKCGYNLTGLLTEQCPECGTTTVARHVVIGVRRRRRVSLVLGLVLLLVASTGWGLGAYGRAKGINWYIYYPAFVLIEKAKLDEARAIDELTRRYNSGRLARTCVDILVPLALDRQRGAQQTPMIWSWTPLLAAFDCGGALGREQQEQFYDQIVSLRVEVRPTARFGDEVRLGLAHWTVGHPSLTGEYRLITGPLQIGNLWQQDSFGEPTGVLSNVGGGSSTAFAVPGGVLSPGHYTATCEVRKEFLCGSDTEWSEPSFVREAVLSANFEVLPPDAPPDVRLVSDPSLASIIRQALSIRITDNPWGMAHADGHLSALITVSGPIPIDCAFEIIGLANGLELDLGSVTLKKGRRNAKHAVQIGRLDVDAVVPVLRRSAEVARETYDIFEIWDGELTFDPIPVERAGR